MVFGLFGGNEKNDEGAAAPATSSPTRPGFESTPGCTALVTGSSGLCGARLVEMLLERGAKMVICFDLAAPDAVLAKRFEVAQETTGGKLLFCHGKEGNLTSDEAVESAFSKEGDKIDVCYHIAALVGPFHDKELYYGVNYEGTMRILAMCKKYKVPKLVYVMLQRRDLQRKPPSYSSLTNFLLHFAAQQVLVESEHAFYGRRRGRSDGRSVAYPR
jgi:hypothetical protein